MSKNLKETSTSEKKIKIDFADWLNFRLENRKRNSKMIIRAFDGTQYPFSNKPDENGNYSWFGAELFGLYHNGMEFMIERLTIDVFPDNKWKYKANEKDKDYETIFVLKIGQINFADIVDYDIDGDEHYNRAIIFCKFKHEGLPFENYYYRNCRKMYQSFEICDIKE
ncbi:hypothetical protein H9X57_16205 [Flavobacterium piscinae]|uniref:hypothetical protein n=1 Tax=Flavobacterium piscinae TaxID=2506424 RepID=UPI0019A1D983|nr:hypothetical protein [Flavobacterium piscinae]MBC8884356.1 hypothetical protein [Flavobacterium piscinae]